jgi:RNA binding chromodomain-containing protein/agenet domain-containing protein
MTATRRRFLGSSLAATAALNANELFATPAAAATPGTNAGARVSAQWEPRKTWVFAVGVLTYPSGQAWPEEGRRDADMIRQLQACGVPTGQIIFIKDKSATIAAVRKSFEAVMAKVPADATLWFYFAGHGAKSKTGVSEFALYDGRWPIPDVFSMIERRFPGTTALLFADCCYSGSLGMEAMLRAGRVSYGAITSSLASAISTGAWTFTECLIDGLRGALPLSADSDGLIAFSDLARYAEREMAFSDGQLSTFVTANGFDPRFVLVPGTKRAHARIGEYVEAKSKDGKWYPGRIEKVDGAKFWIHWAGYKASDNEWVQDGNIRPSAPRQHAAGTRVEVEWQGSWYPAEVLTGRWGMHLVHYDSFEPVWDEWVSPKRIRLT